MLRIAIVNVLEIVHNKLILVMLILMRILFIIVLANVANRIIFAYAFPTPRQALKLSSFTLEPHFGALVLPAGKRPDFPFLLHLSLCFHTSFSLGKGPKIKKKRKRMVFDHALLTPHLNFGLLIKFFKISYWLVIIKNGN